MTATDERRQIRIDGPEKARDKSEGDAKPPRFTGWRCRGIFAHLA